MLKMFIAGLTIPLVMFLIVGSLMSNFQVESPELLETAAVQHSQEQMPSFMPELPGIEIVDTMVKLLTP